LSRHLPCRVHTLFTIGYPYDSLRHRILSSQTHSFVRDRSHPSENLPHLSRLFYLFYSTGWRCPLQYSSLNPGTRDKPIRSLVPYLTTLCQILQDGTLVKRKTVHMCVARVDWGLCKRLLTQKYLWVWDDLPYISILLTTYTTRLTRRLVYLTLSDPKMSRHVQTTLQWDHEQQCYVYAASPWKRSSRRHTLAFDALHTLPYRPRSFVLYCLDPLFEGALRTYLLDE